MLVLVLSLLLTAIQPQLSFTRYTAEEGFPQLPIFGIAQDSRGRIIIASGSSGYYIFDGYDLRIVGGLNHISGFYSSSGGALYAITSDGIYKGLEEGRPECVLKQPDVKAVVETSDKRLWCVSNRQIQEIAENESPRFGLPPDMTAYCACACGNGVLVGTDMGRILRFAAQKSGVSTVFETKLRINVIVPDGGDRFWIGTRGDGLYLWSEENGVLKHITDGLCSVNVLSICKDTEGTVWVGTLKGLNLVAGNTVIGSYRNVIEDRTSLSHNTVRRLFRDTQGGMWLGTYFGGINYWHPSRRSVTNLFPGYGEGFLNDSVTSCISESADGLLWIGTNQGGVNCYDPSQGKFVSRYNIPGSPMSFNDVKAVWHHPDGRRVYIGAYGGGLSLLDRKTGQLKRLPSPSTVQSIVPLGGDSLLLSSGSGRTYAYDIRAHKYKFIRRLQGEFVFQSASGDALSSSRLSRFVFSGDSCSVIPAVPQDYIVGLCERRDSSVIYYATNDSLFRFTPGSGQVSPVNLPDGIPPIVGLECDGHRLWVPTVSGLYSISLETGGWTRYTVKDGLATDFHTHLSHAVISTGQLCFGGEGGLSIIDPIPFTVARSCPAPVVSGASVSGEAVGFSRDSVLSLRHPDNNISIHFSVADYISAGTNVFEYRLDGFDKDWIRAGSERLTTYSNLPRGSYVFQLRVSRKGEDWTYDESALCLKVHPAWYATAVALLLWLFLALAAVYLLFRQQVKRKEKENKLAMYELEERYSKEISKLKVLRVLNTDMPSGMTPVSEISKDDEMFLSRVLSLVEDNIGNPDYFIDDLAISLGMSRSTLHKHMVEATGASALAFIHKIRFSKACELLEKGEYTISEICYKTGFSSPAYFSASFRKRMGCSPQEYSRGSR